jgi:hypothetical protein
LVVFLLCITIIASALQIKLGGNTPHFFQIRTKLKLAQDIGKYLDKFSKFNLNLATLADDISDKK